MDGETKEEFMVCPCCGEEAFVTVTKGFNIVDCPTCEYFFIVYLDETGKAWTRESGVLAMDANDK
jgi:Zn-finger nucleic acid-binding protein